MQISKGEIKFKKKNSEKQWSAREQHPGLMQHPQNGLAKEVTTSHMLNKLQPKSGLTWLT